MTHHDALSTTNILTKRKGSARKPGIDFIERNKQVCAQKKKPVQSRCAEVAVYDARNWKRQTTGHTTGHKNSVKKITNGNEHLVDEGKIEPKSVCNEAIHVETAPIKGRGDNLRAVSPELRSSIAHNESAVAHINRLCDPSKEPLSVEIERVTKEQLGTKSDSDKEYEAAEHLKGSRPQFGTTVLQMKKIDRMVDGSMEPLQNYLRRNEREDEKFLGVLERLANFLREGKVLFSNETPFVCISKTLPLDLNLPMDQHPPDCITDMLLVVGENLSPFIMSVFDTSTSGTSSEEDISEEVNKFTVKMARLLTTSLLNFCACDFVLLPCTVDLKQGELTEQILEKEIQEREEFAKIIHKKKLELDRPSAMQLKEAVIAASSMSRVPVYLQGREEDKALLLDPAWRSVLFLTIDMLLSGQETALTYTKENEFKVKVAVLEAARRLSFREEVAVVTDDDKVATCVSLLVNQAYSEYGMQLMLKHAVSSSTTCIIHVGPSVLDVPKTRARVLHVAEA